MSGATLLREPACLRKSLVPNLILEFEFGFGFVGVRIRTGSGESLDQRLVPREVDTDKRENELDHRRKVLTNGTGVRQEGGDELRRLLEVRGGEGGKG